MQRALVVLSFIAATGFANWLTLRSWNGTVYVYMGERRAPASVRESQDYTALDRQALSRSAHAQLMSAAALKEDAGQIGVHLGLPLVPRPEGGGRDFACGVRGRSGVFSRMELTFYGTGISDNGEEPHLVVDTSCQSGGDLSSLDTIWIPMQDIVSAQAQDQELQVSGEHPAIVRLQHIPSQWPENWVLTSVRFYRDDAPDVSLTLDAKRLREVAPQLLSFDFKAH